MNKTSLVKRTVRITSEASELLNQLAKESDMTISQVTDLAIKYYCGVDARETEDIKRIRIMFSKLSEQNFHLLNLTNSLITNLDFKIFKNFEKEPYIWLTQSKQLYSDSGLRAQTKKLMEEN